jgi:hypothetical protein
MLLCAQHCHHHMHSTFCLATCKFHAGLTHCSLSMRQVNWDDFIFEEGLRVLLSFCLIRLGSSEGLYAVHPLIHAWGKDRMSLDEKKKYGTMAYATLSDSLYGNFT